MDTPCVAGTRIVKMREIVVERYGVDPLSRALDELPEAVRNEYLGASAISWVQATTDYAVHDMLARVLRRPAQELHDELLREALNRSFRTLWRMLLRFTSDEALLRRASSIYSRTRNVGSLSVQTREPGRALVTLQNYPEITARDVHAIGIGLEVVLTFTGRKDVRVAESRQPAGASFSLSWK